MVDPAIQATVHTLGLIAGWCLRLSDDLFLQVKPYLEEEAYALEAQLLQRDPAWTDKEAAAVARLLDGIADMRAKLAQIDRTYPE